MVIQWCFTQANEQRKFSLVFCAFIMIIRFPCVRRAHKTKEMSDSSSSRWAPEVSPVAFCTDDYSSTPLSLPRRNAIKVIRAHRSGASRIFPFRIKLEILVFWMIVYRRWDHVNMNLSTLKLFTLPNFLAGLTFGF